MCASTKEGIRLDRAKCLKFARECKIVLQDEPALFHEVIAFYLDSIPFMYKARPMTQALVPKSKVWRKRSEGLKITAKGYGGRKTLTSACCNCIQQGSSLHRGIHKDEWCLFQ